jgi:hypothetical protein
MTNVKGEVQESNLKLLIFEARVFQLFMAKNHAHYWGWLAGRAWAINNEWYTELPQLLWKFNSTLHFKVWPRAAGWDT